MAEYEKIPITLPDGTTLGYDPTRNLDETLSGLGNYFKTVGSKFNSERGGTMGERAVSGGDVPEAILATLRKNHKWVMPITYSTPVKKKPGPKPKYAAGRPEMEGYYEDIPEAELSVGPGTEQRVAYLIYDPDKNEYYRFNPPGWEPGSIAHGVRGTLETAGDIGGEYLANKLPFLKPLQGLSKAGRAAHTATGMGARGIGAGVGGGMLRGMYDLALNQLGNRVDPRPPKEQAAGMLGTAGMHTLGNIAAEGVLRGPSGIIRKALRGSSPVDELAEAASEMRRATGPELGTPSALRAGPLKDAAIQRRGGFFRSVEGLLHKSPFGNTALGDKILRISKGLDDQITKALKIGPEGAKSKGEVGKEIAETIAGKRPEEWARGESRRKRIGGYLGIFSERSKSEFDSLKRGLDPLSIDSTPVRQLSRELEQKMTAGSSRAILARTGLKNDIKKFLDANNPTYADADDIRKRIGSRMEAARHSGDKHIYELLDKYYKAFKRSQETAPGGVSLMGPRLQALHDRADKWFYEEMNLIDNFLKEVSDVTKEYGGKNLGPYRYVQSKLRAGDAASIEAVVDSVHTIDPATLHHFIQRYVHDLGRESDIGGMAGEFDMRRFVRNWQKAFGDQQTKEMLFKYQPEVGQQLDEFVRIVAHRYPEYSARVNPLFTAGALGTGGIVGGLAGLSQSDTGQGYQVSPWEIALFALTGAGISMGGQYYGAKLLANADFTKWMVDGLTAGKGSFINDVHKLTAIGASMEDPGTKVALGEFITNWTELMTRQYDLHQQRKENERNLGVLDPETIGKLQRR